MGANLAMRDGADLAQALAEHATADDAVTAYEKILIPRSVEAAEGARRRNRRRLRPRQRRADPRPHDRPLIVRSGNNGPRAPGRCTPPGALRRSRTSLPVRCQPILSVKPTARYV
ncbi:hypothetical protein [Streptomyces sp. TLI_185]|uniref:hypothetical protein n=1 Tax=Streptomyces sp. TLI_185 TaxID=2485151 RepID=UPI0037DA308C